jgi:hypothetical protein
VKACVLTARESLDVVDLPRPTPAPHHVLVQVEAASLCGTDVHQYEGTLPATHPRILGHDFAGVVEEVGPEVDCAAGRHDHRYDWLEVGDPGLPGLVLAGDGRVGAGHLPRDAGRSALPGRVRPRRHHADDHRAHAGVREAGPSPVHLRDDALGRLRMRVGRRPAGDAARARLRMAGSGDGSACSRSW